MSETSSSRPHWASRWENRFDAALASVLRRRGWVARVEPYTGYGLAAGTDDADLGWVRVLGRVVLAPRRRRPGRDGGRQARTSEDPTAYPETSAPSPRRLGRPRAEGPEPLRAVRGWRSFLTAQLPGEHVLVTVDGQEHRTVADRGGYVDVVVPSALAEGWHEVRIAPAGGPTVTAPVRVVGRSVRTGLVSDVDDTVMVTSLPRPLTAIWNLLVLHEDARRPVRGMAGLYAEIDALEDRLPVVYLSTNTWNGAAALRRFFAFHGFPAGPMLLTDWGPTNTGLFRSGREHKLRSLERLARELPHVRWILVGDDGQHDPLVYNRFAQMYPDHVRAIAIRQLTPGEQVLAHGAPVPTVQARSGMTAGAGPTIPVVHAADGVRLRGALRAAGVLPGRRPGTDGTSPATMGT